MENPTSANPISSKLTLSNSANVPYGAGVKVFQVNPNPPADILTTHGNKQASGAKYITDNTAADFTVGNLPYILDASATVWTAVASTAGITLTIKIIGVTGNLDEVSENIQLNGTTPVATVNTYKCINDTQVVSGGVFAAGTFCYVIPLGGSPDLRVYLSSTAKSNPYIMVGRKNGVDRKARLRSINNLFITTASTNLNCHIFRANTVQTGTNKGVLTPAWRVLDIPVGTDLGILLPEDGAVELNMGEMAVWYREGASAVATYMSCTWSYHNV
jgi:hypothetical protein